MRMRILIALPNDAQAAEIRMEMENRLWEAETARSGAEVLHMYADFDMVLMHHCLQGMDGLKAGEAIARINPICPPKILLLCPSVLVPVRPHWADCMLESGVSSIRLCSFPSAWTTASRGEATSSGFCPA